MQCAYYRAPAALASGCLRWSLFLMSENRTQAGCGSAYDLRRSSIHVKRVHPKKRRGQWRLHGVVENQRLTCDTTHGPRMCRTVNRALPRVRLHECQGAMRHACAQTMQHRDPLVARAPRTKPHARRASACASTRSLVRGGLKPVRLQAIRCGLPPVADVHERVGLDYMDDNALLCGDRPGSDDAPLRIQVCMAYIPWAQRARRSEDNGAAALWQTQQVGPYRRYHTHCCEETRSAPRSLTGSPHRRMMSCRPSLCSRL